MIDLILLVKRRLHCEAIFNRNIYYLSDVVTLSFKTCRSVVHLLEDFMMKAVWVEQKRL